MTNQYMGHKSVQIPQIGLNVAIGGKWYEVIETVTKQTEPGEFVTHCTIREIDDASAIVTVNLDMVDYTF